MSDRVPSYRRHKHSGQAIVTLVDTVGTRRDVLLGKYGTAASRHEYARVISEWEVNGRRLPQSVASTELTINELALAYLNYAQEHYRRPDGTISAELHCLRSALRPLKHLYGLTVASEFGPLSLKAVRQRMVENKTRGGRPWSRSFVNASVGRLKAMFKWAVENELVPVTVHQALQTVAGLRKGRSPARETKPVKPVPEAFVTATLPHVPAQVKAMIELQELTGMRPGEVSVMRAIDLDTTGNVWLYRPGSDQGEHGQHKSAWRGHDRVIAIGPRAQKIVHQFLKPDVTAYLFDPREAEAARLVELRRNRKTKVQPSQENRKKRRPKRKPGDRYDVDAYRRAIVRGIAKANKARACEGCKDMTPAERCPDCQANAIPHWHPHQLRHNAGTRIRKECGLELARTVLGHHDLDTTLIYAEADVQQAVAVMAKIG